MKIGIAFLLWFAATSSLFAQHFFEPNLGQWGTQTYKARAILPNASWFITNFGYRITLFHPQDLGNFHLAHHHPEKEYITRCHALSIQYVNASTSQQYEFSKPVDFYYNYFLGDNSKNWKSKVYPQQEVLHKNIFPGISARYYFTDSGQAEQDFLVEPGANPSQIAFSISGADAVLLNQGELTLETSVGNMILKKPLAWQEIGNSKKPVSCFYALQEGIVQIKVGSYNPEYTLVIDPILVFSTYSGSKGDNFGYTATYDDSGHLYAGGIVDTTHGQYPTTLGAFMVKAGGMGPANAPVYLGCDATISKYSADGSKLLYATYLGGKSNESPHSLVVNNDRQLLVLGTTLSNNFPTIKKTAFDTTANGAYDIYISRFSEDGTQLLASTYMGGSSNDGINDGALRKNYADDFRGDIYTDLSNNVYVATCTKSKGFPVSNYAFQKTAKGGMEGILFSLDEDLQTLRFSTFLSGLTDDACYSVKLDVNNNLFVGGATTSSDFPIDTSGLNKNFIGGASDGFVMKFTSDSGKYLSGTFYGTDKDEQVFFLDLDIDQNVYLTGQTTGHISRTSGKYGKDNTGQFISSLGNDLDTLLFQTTFGNRSNGVPELVPSAFMVDHCYNIYFSGWGSNLGFGYAGTTNGLQVSSNAQQATTDDNDFYLIALDKYAQNMVYATYFGGSQSEDHVDGGTSRFDKRGVVYQSVCASCPNSPPGLNDFPTTAGSRFPTNVSWRCSNASFKLNFNITYATQANFTYNPKRACLPVTVSFTNLSRNAANSHWDFGDGQTSTATNPTHAYTKPGIYTITLTVTDPASCNLTDVRKATVEILEGPQGQVKTVFDFCNSKVDFELSGADFDQVLWDFGDNNTEANKNKVSHIYIPGQFVATTYLTNSKTGCKDTVKTPLDLKGIGNSDLRVTNIFTPNGDGLNDCFLFPGLQGDCASGEIMIYNRYGVLVYHGFDMLGCWNGKVDNMHGDCPEGMYYYTLKIKYKDGKHEDISFKSGVYLAR